MSNRFVSNNGSLQNPCKAKWEAGTLRDLPTCSDGFIGSPRKLSWKSIGGNQEFVKFMNENENPCVIHEHPWKLAKLESLYKRSPMVLRAVRGSCWGPVGFLYPSAGVAPPQATRHCSADLGIPMATAARRPHASPGSAGLHVERAGVVRGSARGAGTSHVGPARPRDTYNNIII